MTTSSFAGLSRHPAQPKPAAAAAASQAPAAGAPIAGTEEKSRCEGCTGHGSHETGSCATQLKAEASTTDAVINGAIAPAALAMVSDATPSEKPVTLNVVIGHVTPQFAKILRGVVGVCADGNFTIDPIYEKVAYLFTLAGAGLADAGTQLAEVTLPNEDAAKEFIINMIASSGASWDAMYEAAGSSMGTQGDIGKSMIAAEKAQVQRNVKAVVEGANLTVFDVPVTYKAYVGQYAMSKLAPDEETAFSEQQLAQAATPASLTVQLVADAAISPSDLAPEVVPTPISAQCRAHDGSFDLNVTGAAKIHASSVANAQAIFSTLMSISRSMPAQNVLTLAPVLVNNVTLNPNQSDDDDDDEYLRDN